MKKFFLIFTFFLASGAQAQIANTYRYNSGAADVFNLLQPVAAPFVACGTVPPFSLYAQANTGGALPAPGVVTGFRNSLGQDMGSICAAKSINCALPHALDTTQTTCMTETTGGSTACVNDPAGSETTPGGRVFCFSGASTNFTVPTVPAGITQCTVKLWGGGGGSGNSYDGGAGGFVHGSFNVTPGEVLTIYVGGGGTSGNGMQPGAFPDGGNSGQKVASGPESRGAGGGSSSIWRPGNNLVVMAGAGGGGSVYNPYGGRGGAGGGTTATDGGEDCPVDGGGGTQTSGGTAGAPVPSFMQFGGQPGTQATSPGIRTGANATVHSEACMGGGGGGYFGGGSAGFGRGATRGTGGAGGGSSYVGGLNTVISNLRGVKKVPPGITDPNYGANAGYGAWAFNPTTVMGPGCRAMNGRVWIQCN